MLRDQVRRSACLLDHRITTFPQLTDALARDLAVAPRVLEPAMAAVAMAHALARPGLPGPWRGLGRGLAREALRVVSELKAAYLAPADVDAIAAALPPGAGATRLGALGRVYAAYEAELGRLGAVDRRGREWCVAEALAGSRGPLRTLSGVRRVVFREIYEFSVLEFLIATALIRRIGDAEIVAFAHPENVDATRFLERTWNRFVADATIADQVLPGFVERGGRRGSLAAALRGAFATDRPPPAPGDGSVRIVVAPGRYREVEAAVGDVRRRLAEGAAPPLERIAFLARDMTLYGDLIEDVCRRYRLPVHFRRQRPLVANGLVRACLNVLRAVTEGVPRARLQALLDSDYFAATDPRLVRVLADVGFVAESARPLGECVAHRRAMLERETGDPRVPEDRRASAARHAARLAEAAPRLGAVLDTLRALEGRRDVAAHVQAFRRTLRRLAPRPAHGPEPPTPAARRDARAWTRLDQILVTLAGLARHLRLPPVALDEFLRLLVAALETDAVPDPTPPAGSVRALSVLDARGLDFDVVYLLGLDDGTFPAPRGESPLLPDAMRRQANPVAGARLREKLGERAAGLPLGGLLRTAREASLEDPFLFFLALSMPERELILSYPTVDEGGNPTVPSPFLDEVRAAVADVPETILDPTALVPPAGACWEAAELVNRAACDRWAGEAGAPPDRLAAALRAALPDGARRMDAIDRRARVENRRSLYFLTPREDPRKGALADAFVGRLAGPLGALPARLRAMSWSPTRLEQLAACGFKFFAHRVLGLGEDRNPELAVAPHESGTLVHAVLEAFFRAHPDLPADAEAARDLARAFVRRERAAPTIAIAAKDPVFLDLAWDQAAAAVETAIAVEVEDAAARAAAGVGVERLLEEPLERTLEDPAGGPPLVLSGKPDRVDVHRRGSSATALRVLDYKTSRDTARFARMIDPAKELGRTSFQIPVYLLGALARMKGLAADAPLEGGYLVLPAGEKARKMREFGRDLLGEAPAAPDTPLVVSAQIWDLVRLAEAGRFDVAPVVCDPYCPYRTVCRYQPPPLEDEGPGGG